jgi:hypothetical protein
MLESCPAHVRDYYGARLSDDDTWKIRHFWVGTSIGSSSLAGVGVVLISRKPEVGFAANPSASLWELSYIHRSDWPRNFRLVGFGLPTIYHPFPQKIPVL